MLASSALIAALKASLADASAKWSVVSTDVSVDHSLGGVSVSGTVTAGAGTIHSTQSTATTLTTTVSLRAAPVMLAVGSSAQMELIYESVWVNGAFSYANISADGATLRSTDSDLDATVLAMVTGTTQAVAQNVGTPIGSMTGFGGPAAAFDGLINSALACAEGSSAGYLNTVGKDWGADTPKAIAKAIVTGPVDDSFGVGNPPLKLQGSDDNSTWVDLSAEVISNTFVSGEIITLTASDGTDVAAYRYTQVNINGDGEAVYIGEIQFFEAVPGSNFLTDKDASLTAALTAGPSSSDPLLIPPALLASLNTSLAIAGAWEARSYNQNVVKSDGGSVDTEVMISVSAPVTDANGNDVPYVRLIPGSSAPGQFTYTATFDSAGNLIDANVRIDSSMWRTGLDADLNTAVMALGAAYVTATHASVLSAFTAGPQ